jgi:CheY-like chemotaxis protein
MNKESLILLVEDSDEDYESTVRAFRKVRMANRLFRCEDGEQVLDYLFRRGVYSDPDKSPRPALILLDLNLPGTDGRTILSQIKKDPSLKTIPVVVLTTSSDERDISKCYEAGANSFIQKPVSFERYISAIERLNNYWFEIVLLPEVNQKKEKLNSPKTGERSL